MEEGKLTSTSKALDTPRLPFEAASEESSGLPEAKPNHLGSEQEFGSTSGIYQALLVERLLSLGSYLRDLREGLEDLLPDFRRI